jgi:RimJ/RimL family protein N-acetyltransferase
MEHFTVDDSQRLQFRLLQADDAALLYELDQDPEVMKYINGGKPSSMADIESVMIPRMLRYRNPAKGWGLWQVCLRNGGQFIGWILVRPMEFFTDSPELDNLELGWRFKRNSWGKGYATEAAAHFVQVLSRSPDVKRLSAVALADNSGSISVMKKIGMEYVKTYVHRDPLGDEEAVYYQRRVC